MIKPRSLPSHFELQPEAVMELWKEEQTHVLMTLPTS